MKLHDLTESQKMLASFKKDIQTINNHQDKFFQNRLVGEIDIQNKENFNKIKDWNIFFALEDKCVYANELAIILKSEEKYAVINYYNAGDSVATFMKVVIIDNKTQLKHFFKTTFAFNGLDEVNDKITSPRFDFDTLIDLFPEVKSLEK